MRWFYYLAVFALTAAAIAASVVATAGDSDELPIVGRPHHTRTPAEIIEFDLPEAFASPERPRLRWTFFLSATPSSGPNHSDRYAIWLNEELIYHNTLAAPRWMPEVRHFESDRLKDGRYRLTVRNTTSGEQIVHEFAADKTHHLVIFARQTRPMTVRTFASRVQYR